MGESTCRGSPKRFASAAISRRVSGRSSTPQRLRALVLAQQIVERFAQENGLLLLRALRQAPEPAELRGGVIGGLEHHVVAGGERDRRSALVLRGVQGEVGLAHQVLGC